MENKGIDALLEVMKRLRDPNGGCPWDIEQSFESIVPYTIEEAYEVADAIEHGTRDDLKEELGDLLLQVVFHAQMAQEEGAFDFDAVAGAEAEKLISRHPHVFGDEKAHSAEDVVGIWNAQKDKEKAGKITHLLDGVTKGLPALMRGQKIHRKVAKVGFDWPNIDDVFAKLDEEIAELKQARVTMNRNDMAEELGDILFVTCVLAEHLGVDSETCLRNANNKFIKRFNGVEDLMRTNGQEFGAATLPQMDEHWQTVKRKEREAKDAA